MNDYIRCKVVNLNSNLFFYTYYVPASVKCKTFSANVLEIPPVQCMRQALKKIYNKTSWVNIIIKSKYIIGTYHAAI